MLIYSILNYEKCVQGLISIQNYALYRDVDYKKKNFINMSGYYQVCFNTPLGIKN